MVSIQMSHHIPINGWLLLDAPLATRQEVQLPLPSPLTYHEGHCLWPLSSNVPWSAWIDVSCCQTAHVESQARERPNNTLIASNPIWVLQTFSMDLCIENLKGFSKYLQKKFANPRWFRSPTSPISPFPTFLFNILNWHGTTDNLGHQLWHVWLDGHRSWMVGWDRPWHSLALKTLIQS